MAQRKLPRLPYLLPRHRASYLRRLRRTVTTSLLLQLLNRLRLHLRRNLPSPPFPPRNPSSSPTSLRSTQQKLLPNKPNSRLKKLRKREEHRHLHRRPLEQLPPPQLPRKDRNWFRNLPRARSPRPLLPSSSSPTRTLCHSPRVLQFENPIPSPLPLPFPPPLKLQHLSLQPLRPRRVNLHHHHLGLPRAVLRRRRKMPSTLSSVRKRSNEVVRARSTSRKISHHSE